MLPKTLLLSLTFCSGYETKWFTQLLTHVRGDTRTFRQRYLVESYVGRSTAPLPGPAPVLFYSGNEGPIDGFWESAGFLHYLGAKLGAVVLFAEARYYGESVPDEDVKWLKTELILADYANLVTQLKRTGDLAADSPVVVFGGSYGGTLATFLRLTNPDVFVGALAASAPIGYYDRQGWAQRNVTENTWADRVAHSYAASDPRCLDAIAATTAALRATPAPILKRRLHLCDGSTVSDHAELFQYALEGLPQQDYAHAVGRLPPWPVRAACGTLVNATDRVHAASSILMATLGNGTCVGVPAEGPGGVPGDGPGAGAWGFQSCTETLHEFSSATPVRRYAFNLTAQSELCRKLYGVTPDPTYLTKRFGGYEIPNKVTNVFFSRCGLDPWTGGTFTEGEPHDASVAFCFMPSGAHHADLRAPRDDDPKDIVACRAREERAIAGWVVAARSGEGSRRWRGGGAATPARALRSAEFPRSKLRVAEKNASTRAILDTCPVEAFKRSALHISDLLPGSLDKVGGIENVLRVYKERWHLAAADTTGTHLCDPAWPLSTRKKKGLLVNLGAGTTGTRYLQCVMHTDRLTSPRARLAATDEYDYISDLPLPYQVVQLLLSHPGRLTAGVILTLRDPVDWVRSRVSHHGRSGATSRSCCSVAAPPCGRMEWINASRAEHEKYYSALFFAYQAWVACLATSPRLGYDRSHLYALNVFAKKPANQKAGLYAALKRFVGGRSGMNKEKYERAWRTCAEMVVNKKAPK